ncbi:MAG: hypothetical protein ACK52I_29270 [Pseudomonadota bacterium]
MNNATPRPWITFDWVNHAPDETSLIDCIPIGPAGAAPVVADVLLLNGDHAETEANAALIVRAVNHHDELVAALDGLLGHMEAPRSQKASKAWDAAMAVLAKVRA